jgi:hypothetical protein
MMLSRHFRHEILAIGRKLAGQYWGWRCQARDAQCPVACRPTLRAIDFLRAKKICTKLRKRGAKFRLLQQFVRWVMPGRLPLTLTA